MTDKEVQEKIKVMLKNCKERYYMRSNTRFRKKKASNPDEPLKEFFERYEEDLKKKMDEILNGEPTQHRVR